MGYNLFPGHYRHRYVELPSESVISSEKTRRVSLSEAIEIFAGANGMSLGLIQSVYEVVPVIVFRSPTSITCTHNHGRQLAPALGIKSRVVRWT